MFCVYSEMAAPISVKFLGNLEICLAADLGSKSNQLIGFD